MPVTWIYLSPHFDDVALSCGGLVWEQAQAGEPVQVWTICAGDVPPGPLSPFASTLHTRWDTEQNAPAQRRVEDFDACRLMGATPRHFDLADCIYRRNPKDGCHLYNSEEGIFGPLDVVEGGLVTKLADDLQTLLPDNATVVCPLTLGGHVDHRLTRLAAKKIGFGLWYYADYPYVLVETPKLDALRQSGWQTVDFPVSEEGYEAWIASITAYASQVSTFWSDTPSLQAAMHSYWQASGCNVRLWRPKKIDE